MPLTAIRLQRMGLAFTAVHDSYWTHGADVDVMNDTLRECFVDLYSQPILEDLRSNLQVVLRFRISEIPPRGTLDLGDVLSSRYFFN